MIDPGCASGSAVTTGDGGEDVGGGAGTTDWGDGGADVVEGLAVVTGAVAAVGAVAGVPVGDGL